MASLRRILALAIAGVACAASSARAQEVQATPYSESVYREGPGIRLGGTPLTLHPGVAVEGGYDSNVFYTPTEVGSGMLRIRGHIDLATLPPQAFENDASSVDPKLDFRLSTQLEYREYLSENQNVVAQRSLNILGSTEFVVLPRGPFTLRISDLYVRTVDPRNEEGTGNFTRDYNRFGLLGEYRFGTLTVGAGDYFQFNYWETDKLQFSNSYSDEGQLFGRLRVLSQTLLSLVARFGFTEYYNNPSVNAKPLRVLAGVSSLLSTWFGASASIGYGNSLSAVGPSANGVIGGVEARFLLPHRARIGLGYDRDFADSIFANFFFDDHFYLLYQQPVVRRISAHFDGGIRLRHYDGLINPILIGASGYSSPTRDDVIYEIRAELSVQAASWLAFAASYTFLDDSTDFAILSPTGAATPVHYAKHSAFLRADIAY